MKKSKDKLVLLVLLWLSLIINLVFAYFYFYKQAPYLKEVVSKLEEAKDQLSSVNCKKVYSQSEGKVVCLTNDELKSKALSECSKNFKENLDEKILKAIRTISDLEKLQGLSIKMCMQEKGFDY